MTVRYGRPQSLPARCPAIAACHVGRRPVDPLRGSTIDEDQAVWVEIGLRLEPRMALAQDVGAVLLGGMRCLFFRV